MVAQAPGSEPWLVAIGTIRTVAALAVTPVSVQGGGIPGRSPRTVRDGDEE